MSKKVWRNLEEYEELKKKFSHLFFDKLKSELINLANLDKARTMVEEMILAGQIKVVQKKILSEYGTKIKNQRDLHEFASAKEIMDTSIDGDLIEK